MGLPGIGVIAVLVRGNGTKRKKGQVFYFKYVNYNEYFRSDAGVGGRAGIALVQVRYFAGPR